MRPAISLSVVVALLIAPSLAAAEGRTIEGTVTAPVPVQEVEVCVVEAQPSESCTYPSADGTYALHGLIPGRYFVEFLPSYRSHLLRQYYDGKASLEEAELVVVKGTEDTLGIDAHLQLGGQINGRVTDATGAKGLQDVEACAFDATDRTIAGCAESDENGVYAIPTLPTGSYRLGFWGVGRSATYLSQYYLNESSFVEADPVAVVQGATISEIDVGLQMGARIEGTVRDASSLQALTGVSVCLLKPGSIELERCTATTGDGGYSLQGLPDGAYTVVFSPDFGEEDLLPRQGDGYLTQYYAGEPTLAAAAPVALVAPGVASGIDAYLIKEPSLVPRQLPTIMLGAPQAAVTPAPAVGRPKKCKKGFRKRTVKGRWRCVKVPGRKNHRGTRF